MKARLPQGMGGGPSNMQGMVRQVQKMQEQMTELQEELDSREYEINAGGGVVSVKINGKKEVLSISIKPEIVDPDDIETLSDVLVGTDGLQRYETLLSVVGNVVSEAIYIDSDSVTVCKLAVETLFKLNVGTRYS